MKIISETQALRGLNKIKTDLKFEVSNYERRAKNCQTCKTQGACCTDAHFVNVHISRLETVAIKRALKALPADIQNQVSQRISEVIVEYGLAAKGDTREMTYACPLFEKGVGCLVHKTGKPVPCIVHACYERKADLPPDELHTTAEKLIDALNSRTYGRPQPWLPLPLAIKLQTGDLSNETA